METKACPVPFVSVHRKTPFAKTSMGFSQTSFSIQYPLFFSIKVTLPRSSDRIFELLSPSHSLFPQRCHPPFHHCPLLLGSTFPPQLLPQKNHCATGHQRGQMATPIEDPAGPVVVEARLLGSVLPLERQRTGCIGEAWPDLPHQRLALLLRQSL